MKYLVATFEINANAELMQVCRDLLADSAAEAGFESFEETQTGIEAYVQKDLFDKEALDTNIAHFPIEGTVITYHVEEAEDKDWNQTWEEQGFSPICIDRQVVIYDAKHPELYHADEIEKEAEALEIGIEAQLAFGTGNHETTRMIVATMLGMNLRMKRVLDCGTGTGILGIVASKLGAKDVIGYDIDEWSVQNALHNAQINLVENMEVLNGNASVISHISGIFDVVFANINRNILLEDIKKFRSVMDDGSYLVLSGFYEEDIPLLLEKAEEMGMQEIERHTDNDWACLVLKS